MLCLMLAVQVVTDALLCQDEHEGIRGIRSLAWRPWYARGS